MTMQNKLQYDVVCAGGGASGVFAAVSAARAGARVLLLERTGFLGGTAALGLMLCGLHTPYSALLREFFGILAELDGAPDGAGQPDHPEQPDAPAVLANGETVKLAFHRLCRESGVDVLLYTEANALRLQDGAAAGVCAVGKSGMLEVCAPAVIDATGTGDLVRSAGVLEADEPAEVHALMTLAALCPKGEAAVPCRGGEAAILRQSGEYDAPYRGQECAAPCKGMEPDAVFPKQENWLQTAQGIRYAVYPTREAARCLLRLPLQSRVALADPVSWTKALHEAHLQMLALLRALSGQVPGGDAVRLSAVPPRLLLCGAPCVRRTGAGTGSDKAAGCDAADRAADGAVRDDVRQKTGMLPEDVLVPQIGGLLACGALAVNGDNAELGSAFATGEAAGLCAAHLVKAGASG